MNNKSIAGKLLLLVLAIMLISNACTNTEQGNVEACTVGNQPDRVKWVKDHLDSQLKDLAKPGEFEYVVFPIGPAAVGVRFEGTLSGYTGGLPNFHRLSNALNAGIIKSKCIGSVEYGPLSASTSETKESKSSANENTESESPAPQPMSLIWTACDPPDELCPDGQCSSSCRGKIYK